VEETLKPTKTVYTVSQFLDWLKQGTLDLNPIFQRRPVWKAPAKSQLIDSVVRGYPVPIILLRQVQDFERLTMRLEVVDGQQRLRTLLSYIDPTSIPRLAEADLFTVRKTHNPAIAGRTFAALPQEVKQSLLAYELSTHVFPATTGDEQVFRIFARLNSTGLSLNEQEVRNSEFHGAFKSLVYELSFENLGNWRQWKVFTNDAISRMEEAEAVSEYILAMTQGITGKSQSRITSYYRSHEEDYSDGDVIRQRFEATINAIGQHLSDAIPGSAFQRATLFYSLFAAIYHHMYGLGSPLRRAKAQPLPRGLSAALQRASQRIRSRDLPERVQDAMDKATGDKARRDQRHKFIMGVLKLEAAG
jgi:Protein of unknown function DUF262